eukprot:TRINITY_DN4505_c0_g1_i1.p1 TRINITY_DN4505_c0_g1~~TRINITY_DN4505_c0_g1_i1.p1  ORF type:complete len:277 (+),score=57.40 TRINITY_DN4505_c0_g1_i1:28-858(+)
MESFTVLTNEAEDLYTVSRIDRITLPTPLEFYREYVSQNRPVIITGGFDNWKALQAWTNDYLRKKVGDTEVSVAVTPNGRADAIDGDYFTKPCEKRMKFNQFMDIIEHKGDSNAVHYIQHQNANFTDEYQLLWDDIDQKNLNWAEEAFGNKPDAVNIWIGTNDSVTALHKDHYENIYCVISGEKIFTLLPPTDLPYLYEREYPCATYHESSKDLFEVKPDEPVTKIPWISVDPDYPNLEKHPLFSRAKPVRCVVGPGEMLYLPSLYLGLKQRRRCF